MSLAVLGKPWSVPEYSFQGTTVRSSNDCLIAQTALEHRLILLNNDEDFRQIGKVLKELKHTSI